MKTKDCNVFSAVVIPQQNPKKLYNRRSLSQIAFVNSGFFFYSFILDSIEYLSNPVFLYLCVVSLFTSFTRIAIEIKLTSAIVENLAIFIILILILCLYDSCNEKQRKKKPEQNRIAHSKIDQLSLYTHSLFRQTIVYKTTK